MGTEGSVELCSFQDLHDLGGCDNERWYNKLAVSRILKAHS